jgi:hypothetical protein
MLVFGVFNRNASCDFQILAKPIQDDDVVACRPRSNRRRESPLDGLHRELRFPRPIAGGDHEVSSEEWLRDRGGAATTAVAARMGQLVDHGDRRCV